MKLAICGHFGKGKNLLNGQTVKTKILSNELNIQFKKEDIWEIDTHGTINTILIFTRLMEALYRCKNIIILPAHRGVKSIATWLMLWNILFHRRLHYVVIGGWLPEFVKKRRFLAWSLKRFYGIYVETSTMKRALEEQGFSNVYVMPNCKYLDIIKPEELSFNYTEPYKLCTFSRVMKEKGIGDAVEVIKAINEKVGKVVYELDIYGSIDANQTDWFAELQKGFPEYIHYKGCVDFDKSVDTLKEYFALLFPTYYSGEGFAGTIIDAFAAGLPIIASNWKYNAEIIKDGISGYIYPTQDNNALCALLIHIANNVTELIGLKKNCIIEAENYLPQIVVQTLTKNFI